MTGQVVTVEWEAGDEELVRYELEVRAVDALVAAGYEIIVIPLTNDEPRRVDVIPPGCGKFDLYLMTYSDSGRVSGSGCTITTISEPLDWSAVVTTQNECDPTAAELILSFAPEPEWTYEARFHDPRRPKLATLEPVNGRAAFAPGHEGDGFYFELSATNGSCQTLAQTIAAPMIGTPPPYVHPLSPACDTIAYTGLLSWTEVTDASYELEISTTGSFPGQQTILLDAGVTSHDPPDDPNPQFLRWRVRSVNDCGASEWAGPSDYAPLNLRETVRFANRADDSFSMARAPDGSVYVAGRSSEPFDDRPQTNSRSTGYLAKYQPNGTWVWTQHFLLEDEDWPRSMLVTTDAIGDAIVAYPHWLSVTTQFEGLSLARGSAVHKVSRDGSLQWMSNIADGNHAHETQVLVTDSANQIYLVDAFETADQVGHFSGPSGQWVNTYYPDIRITKLDSSGNVLWSDIRGEEGSEDAAGATVGPDGSVYVVGTTYSVSGGGQILEGGFEDIAAGAFILKYSASGAREWGINWDGDVDAIAVGPGGDIFVAGADGFLNEWGKLVGTIVVGRYDPDGNEIWRRTRGEPGLNLATAVLVTDDAEILVAGITNNHLDGWANVGLPGFKTFLTVFDLSGNWLATRLLDDPLTGRPVEIARDPGGDTFLTSKVSVEQSYSYDYQADVSVSRWCYAQ